MKVQIEWIALTEKLPEKERTVLLTKRFGNFILGFLSPEGEWWGDKGRIEIKYQTHWAYPVGIDNESL